LFVDSDEDANDALKQAEQIEMGIGMSSRPKLAFCHLAERPRPESCWSRRYPEFGAS